MVFCNVKTKNTHCDEVAFSSNQSKCLRCVNFPTQPVRLQQNALWDNFGRNSSIAVIHLLQFSKPRSSPWPSDLFLTWHVLFNTEMNGRLGVARASWRES